MKILKSSAEVTELINSIIIQFELRLRALRNGKEWKLEFLELPEEIVVRTESFPTRSEAVRWMVENNHARGLSFWMAECDGDLIE